jgi:hypothetical protein
MSDWKPVPGWPYEVTADGRVRRGGRELRVGSGWGSSTVTLSSGGVARRFKVGALVAMAFGGVMPTGCARSVQNLRGEMNPSARLMRTEALSIRSVLAADLEARRKAGFKSVTYGLVQSLAARYGVSPACVRAIKSGASWRS